MEEFGDWGVVGLGVGGCSGGGNLRGCEIGDLGWLVRGR